MVTETMIELDEELTRAADVRALEARINLAWAVRDGRDPHDAMIARIDAELARIAARKAVR